MNKVYQRTNWENTPSTATPINEANLNNIEEGIDSLDDRIIEIEQEISAVECETKYSDPGALEIAEITINGISHHIYAPKGSKTNVIDSLDSASKTDALSANQGRALNESKADKSEVEGLIEDLTQLSESIIEMNGYPVIYDMKWIEGEYVELNNGTFVKYNTWVRTDYNEIPTGVNKIFVFGGEDSSYNVFYDASKNVLKSSAGITRSFTVYYGKLTEVDIPQGAKYFVLSGGRHEGRDFKNTYVKNETISIVELDEKIKSIVDDESKIIDCWGDSLTQGSGSTSGNAYPNKLQGLVGSTFTVNNYGQGSETAEAVAFRQGGMSAIVQPFTISSASFIPIDYKAINGASLETVSYSALTYGDSNVYVNGMKLMFRNRGGGIHAIAVTNGSDIGKSINSEMMLRAEGMGIKHIMIVCIGQNGWVDDNPEHLADVIQNMIDHNDYKKYIICGRPTGTKRERETEENVLGSRFGNHYVNLRQYISAYGLSDENITPTEDDTSAMTNGAIPPSLKTDGVHLNNSGYSTMAKCIYQRGKDLGYWS